MKTSNTMPALVLGLLSGVAMGAYKLIRITSTNLIDPDLFGIRSEVFNPYDHGEIDFDTTGTICERENK